MDRVVVVSVVIRKIGDIDWCYLEPVHLTYRLGQ